MPVRIGRAVGAYSAGYADCLSYAGISTIKLLREFLSFVIRIVGVARAIKIEVKVHELTDWRESISEGRGRATTILSVDETFGCVINGG